MSLRGDALRQRFDALTHWLETNQRFWRPRPFVDPHPAWANEEAGWSEWLLNREPGELSQLEAGVTLAGEPVGMRDLTLESVALTELPSSEHHALALDPCARGLKLRKRLQIDALASRVVAEWGSSVPLHVSDWCSGKGHLGRTIAEALAAPLSLIERDARLCADGHRLAESAGLRCTVHQVDVLADEAPLSLARGGVFVALHACGRLGVRGLEVALASAQELIVFAPCCYHRGYFAAPYLGLSERARAGGLHFDHSGLRLATLDEGIGSARGRRERHKEQAWRLAFDSFLRDVHGRVHYTAMGSIPKRVVRGAFGDFMKAMALKAGVSGPRQSSLAEWEARGLKRAHGARALGALRSIFRRPIEVWLALDRALMLEEAGMGISLHVFCAQRVSPRNLAIVARR